VEVAKVKKTAVVTGVRNVKASKRNGKAVVSKAKPERKSIRTSAKKKPAVRTATARGKVSKAGKAKAPHPTTRREASMAKVKSISAAKARARNASAAPQIRVAVKPLEPQAKCGAGTSVQYLFRVDESVDGRTTTHLVFFDRHGWYCEHGRNCPAVGHAKKYQGHIARAS
jgi:hypothetical protein